MIKKPTPLILSLLLVGGVYTAIQQQGPASNKADVSASPSETVDLPSDGSWMIGTGVVTRILSDDNKGSRHQRFIVAISNSQTLLVAHNIDLAPRVAPIDIGDTIIFQGMYETNHRGGVIHWTHHDPQGRRRGGWLEREGKRFK